MFTDKQIEQSFGKINEISEEELTAEFQKMIQKQNSAIGFVMANVGQHKLEENTKHATIELLFYIFDLYKSSGFKDALTEDSIIEAIKKMDLVSSKISEEIGGLSKEDIQVLNKAIELGKSDALTGKPKAILDAILNKKKQVSQPILLEFISMNISKDELIVEKDKSFVFSIMESLIEAIQLQYKKPKN